MNNLVNSDADFVASVVVKSRSKFPDLFPFEEQVAVVREGSTVQWIAKCGVVCKEFLAGLPLVDLGVIIAIFALVNA